MERAESKNLFKKDPITNKRRPPKPGDNTFMSKLALGEHGITRKSSGGAPLTKAPAVGPSTKKRRVSANSTSEEEDVMDVASFLAGLKSKPKQPQEDTTAPPTAAKVKEDKSAEGGVPRNTSVEDVNKVEAIFASRMNNMLANHRHLVPVPNNNSLTAMPSTTSLPQTTARVPKVNVMNGNNAVNVSNQSLHMNDPNTFDRESLRRLSTDQLVALASQMKLREQMLRERTLSLQATMAPTIAPMASTNNSEFYHEMLLQSRAMRGSLPSQSLLPQGMAQSLIGVNKPKSSYEELAALNGLQHSTTTGIPNISPQNLGYPRAA